MMRDLGYYYRYYGSDSSQEECRSIVALVSALGLGSCQIVPQLSIAHLPACVRVGAGFRLVKKLMPLKMTVKPKP